MTWPQVEWPPESRGLGVDRLAEENPQEIPRAAPTTARLTGVLDLHRQNHILRRLSRPERGGCRSYYRFPPSRSARDPTQRPLPNSFHSRDRTSPAVCFPSYNPDTQSSGFLSRKRQMQAITTEVWSG